MARKKVSGDDALKYDIKTRINQFHFNRLNGLLAKSNYRNISELLRDIICEKPIVTYTEDKSLETVCSELTRIRKELNAIGRNINQVTREFNSPMNQGNRMVKVLEVAAFYKEVDARVNELFPHITALVRLWLQK